MIHKKSYSWMLTIAIAFMALVSVHAQTAPGGVSNGLSLWLKSDAGATVNGGNELTQWSDQSASAHTETITGTPILQENGLNFNPITNFAGGGSEYISFPNFASSWTEGAGFIVVRAENDPHSSKNDTGLWTIGGNGASESNYPWTNASIYEGFGGNSSSRTVVNPTQPLDVFHIYNVFVDPAETGQTQQVFLDAALLGSYNVTPSFSSPSNVHIGLNSNGSRSFDGEIAEVALYSNNTSASERLQIQSYLAIKYGITLDQTTPTNYLASDSSVIWDTTINATYNNNITGIGRDDVAALNQKQSKSINNDAMLTVGLGAITTSNILNSNTFDADRNFLVWGNDNGSTSLQTNELPTGAYAAYRIGREWKVQETGTVSNLTLEFDAVATAFSPELYIDTDGDGDFTNATVVTGTVVNGKVVFTGIDFNNGDLFTVGYSVPSPGGLLNELSVWFKADFGVYSDAGNTAIVEGTNNVQEWHELSLNPVFVGNQPQETSVGDKPSYVANGVNFNPTLYFEGAGDALRTPTAFDSDAIRDVAGEKATVYVIGNGAGTFMDHGDAGTGNFIVRTDRAAFGQSSNLNYTTVVGTQFQLISGVRSGSGTLNMYLDGLANGTNTDGDASTTNRIFTIGTNDNNNFYLTGNLSEIIVFRDGHDATQRNMVQSYLALKYGITLNQTTPTNYLASDASVIWDATINATYNNNITGIGRDDVTALNQKVSKSINTSAILTLALDADFMAPNADIQRTTAHTNNKQYLLVGSNGAALDLQATELETNPNYNMRIGREWKISKTANFNQNINLKFEGYDNEWYLIASPTGDFSTGVTLIGSLDANGAINASLADGTVYTLASFVKSPGGVNSGLSLWLKADQGARTNLLQDADLSLNDGSWTTTGNVFSNSGFFNFNSGNATPNGVVAQSVATVANTAYALKYRVHQIHTGSQTYRGPVSLKVTVIDNTTSQVLATETIEKYGYTPATYHNLNFAATSNDTRVEITDTSTSSYNIDIRIDEFRLASVDDVNNGAAVDIWQDQSRTGNDGYQFQQATPKQATLTEANLNFNPALTFDGADDFYHLPVGMIDEGNTNYSIISVQTQNVQEEGQILFLGKNSANDGIFHQLDVSGQLEASWQNNPLRAGASVLNAPDIFTATYDNTSGRLIRQDGLQVGADGSTALTFIEDNTNHIGRYISDAYFDGTINEIIVYNNNTTSGTDLQRIESYLALKYGIALDQTTPQDYLASDASVIWNAAANATYNNNITGIGRDDVTALNQKQSKSVNEDALVTIGLGDIAATNAANVNSFAADKNFLVWGNDNGSADLQTTDLPAGASANRRLGREWKVAETGNVNNLTITFSDTGISSSAINLELFVDTDGDGDFSNATVVTGGTYSGGEITFTGVDLNDGDVFTLGVTIPAPGGIIGGLNLWLRADKDAITSGTQVTEWQDQIQYQSQAFNATQATSSYQPVFTEDSRNFNPGITFDGSNDFYNLPEGILDEGNTNYAVISVQTQMAGNTSSILSLGYRVSNRTINHELYLGNQFENSWYSNYFRTGTSTYMEPSIFTATYNNTSGRAIRQDGLEIGTNPATTLNYVQYANRNGIGLNNIYSRTNYFNGDINEVIVYNATTTTAAELQRIESYLALKYGITLDQTTPQDYLASDASVIWDASANAAYSFDIAGIGKDDGSALMQKQSKSVNKSGMVTIGLGAIEATNATNANTFAADKNFLVWGSDKATNDVQATELPAGAIATFRLQREWKVQETGTINNLSMAFDYEKVSANATDLELYIDTDGDGDFSNATIITGGTIANGQVTFTGVDLNDGDVFTLGLTVTAPGGVIGGLNLWLRADKDAITSGTLVTEWQDQTGAFNATQASASYQPVFTENSRNFNPGLTFDTEYFEIPVEVLDQGNTNYAVISVQTQTVSGTGAILNLGLKSNNRTLMHHLFSSGIFENSWYGNYFRTGTSTLMDPDIFTSTYNNTSGRTIRQNGLELGTDPSLVFNYNQVAGMGSLGADPNGNGVHSYFKGDINEMIVYNATTTTAVELQRIESYLAIKYGITLDQTTPQNYLASDETIIWDATANAAYSFDIAGIGKDDGSALTQKQSKSVNKDGMVTIGLGAIATTNAANTNTFAANKNFLLWGSDNTGTALQTTELPAGAMAKYRLQREWKAQETGTISNLSVAFDYEKVSASATDLELYIDTDGDGDFSNATIITGGTIANGQVTFAGVDLNDGDVFTLGLTTAAPGGVANSLNLWLRADKGAVVSSGEVTAWEDQAKSFDATPVGISYQADFTENSRNFNPGLTFSGSYYDLPTGILDNGNTSYAMISVTTRTNTSRGTILSFGLTLGSTYKNKIVTYEIDQYSKLYSTWYQNVFTAGTVVSNTPSIFTATYNNTSGRTMRKDGLVTGTNASTALNYVQIPSKNMIGAYNAYTSRVYPFNGDMNEIIVYNATATSALELQRIESYLAVKYGITLDQTTPQDYLTSDASVIWDAVTYATFGNDIAGIGRDDGSDLLQKQSKSVNSDALVTIGLGEIATTNILNGSAFNADGDFLLWGNDNASTVVVNSGIPSVFSEKINRTWLVQETGAVGSTLVQIPDSAVAGFSTTDGVSLFIADDAGFTLNLVQIPLVQNGANWEAMVDFNGIKYFSFGLLGSGDYMRHGKHFQGGEEKNMKF